MTHTSGPWGLHSPTEGDPRTGDGSYCITGPHGGVIAKVVPPDWHETPANARLIASAPEMAAAIKRAGRLVNRLLDGPLPSKGKVDLAFALSRVSDELGPMYYRATGQPLL